MIKLEHVVLPSPEQMEFVIEGMRNPMNSWDNSDSGHCYRFDTCEDCSWYEYAPEWKCYDNNPYMLPDSDFIVGKNDITRMKILSHAATDHRKFMRMMSVCVRITAPLYWWKEFDTYKVGTVANSCSTMHKITEKEFTLDDFSHEHMIEVTLNAFEKLIEYFNVLREAYLNDDIKDPEKKKEYWWQIIQLLPSSYNQTRNVMLNYEVLANMYKSRKNHKLDEWVNFCEWIESLPFSEIITGKEETTHE